MRSSSASLFLLLAIIAGCRATENDNLPDCSADAVFEGVQLESSIQHAVDEAVVLSSTDLGQLRPSPEHRARQLNETFGDAIRGNTIEEASAAVLLDGGQYWSTAQSNRFWWGSIGKAFTAMAVLQLVDEGKLQLTASVAEFVPYIPNARFMTILDLLSHTAGLYNFTRRPYEHTATYQPPTALIAISMLHGPDWCPGTRWGYSNTGYLILGQIIEQVTERPYHEVINEDVLDRRLGDTSLVALSPGPAPSGVALPTARGYSPSITTPFAAGVLVGTALDMAIAWKRFLTGAVISQSQVRKMFEDLHPTDVPGRVYGLGVMAWQRSGGDVWLGHRGSIDGARALVVWSLKHEAVVAVALTGDGDAEAMAEALLDVLPATTYY